MAFHVKKTDCDTETEPFVHTHISINTDGGRNDGDIYQMW